LLFERLVWVNKSRYVPGLTNHATQVCLCAALREHLVIVIQAQHGDQRNIFTWKSQGWRVQHIDIQISSTKLKEVVGELNWSRKYKQSINRFATDSELRNFYDEVPFMVVIVEFYKMERNSFLQDIMSTEFLICNERNKFWPSKNF
jgi:hypothetical protein